MVKKICLIILLVAIVAGIGFALVNASSNSNSNSNLVKEVAESTKVANTGNKIDVEITDNFFIEATNDVYLNLNEYVGKTIRMQGLVYSYETDTGERLYAVVRNTPGCCGNDGLAGLDIRYNEDYPEENTWVEVVGVVGEDTVYGDKIPAIQVTSITETAEGETFVTN